MHMKSSNSSTDEEGEQDRIEEEDKSSPRDDYNPMENLIRNMDQVVAPTPDEKELSPLLRANHATRDDLSSRFVTPTTRSPTVQQPPQSRSSFDVPSPLSNNDGFPARSMLVDYQYQVLYPVSVASSVEAESRSQEPETREYQRNHQAHDDHHRHHQHQHHHPVNNEKTTAMAAGLATTIILTILLGITVGLMGGLFAAYAHDKEGILGDCSRALGEVALLTREKAMDINARHKLVRRVRFALMIGWECATTIDRQNNAFKNMIVHGPVVLANLMDAFHYETTRFHSHSFWREDILLDHDDDDDDDDDISTACGMEPIDLLRRARY